MQNTATSRYQKLSSKILQLSLLFQPSVESNFFKEEDFLLLAENSVAFDLFEQFFAQKKFANSQIQSLILKGEKASGKTHLLNIFAEKYSAQFLSREKILNVNPSNFFTANHYYILENFEEIKDEELLLRLINSATEAQAFLALSAQKISQFKLPDLTSRLKNIHRIEIKSPSRESLKLLLANQLSRRQIKVSQSILNFISNNIEQSFEAIFDVLKFLEDLSYKTKNIGLSEVKKFLKDVPKQS
jgi:chromosomal replication initiation ATPase DnaA